jgi:hypothetical protein
MSLGPSGIKRFFHSLYLILKSRSELASEKSLISENCLPDSLILSYVLMVVVPSAQVPGAWVRVGISTFSVLEGKIRDPMDITKKDKDYFS